MTRLPRRRRIGALAATMATALTLAGFASAPANSTDAAPARAVTPGLLDSPAPRAIHEWLRYDRPAEYESVRSQIRVPMRDGTRIACDLYRPGHDGTADTARHPSIMADFTPYLRIASGPRAGYLAERGYNVLSCDVRGSGNSTGTFPSWFQPKETTDNYDLIEWLARQPYATGDVGQMGESYGSITSYRAAALKPPHLRAIIPIVSPTDIYAEWVYPGGVPSVNGAWWANSGPVISPEDHTNTLRGFQRHPLYDAYWKQAVTTNKLRDVEVPALHIGGYFDIFKNGGFDALEQRPRGTWLLNGPWTHGGFLHVPGTDPVTHGVDLPNAISASVVLQWFDHWLAKRPGAQLPPDRVISYASTSAKASGRWEGHRTWPSASASGTRLYPTADGALAASAPAATGLRYQVNPIDGPSADVTGTLPYDPGQNQAPAERNGTLPNGNYATNRATFTLPAFTANTTLAGPVTLHLNASISAEDTYFVSKLETVLPDGRVLPIETGYLRAQLRDSLEKAKPVTPGAPTQYTIALGQTHWQFKPGEKLRVTIGGGDSPRIIPDNPAGSVTVHLGGRTYVDMPALRYLR
ncbi:CocE/NonD family hydrolase [Streptomyces sp. NPDC101062]|uniref:CocE/NonD family hydrolase n=1 Tax=unclassified Streptomyces TaxID=2593676 RepID=UPI00381ACD39